MAAPSAETSIVHVKSNETCDGTEISPCIKQSIVEPSRPPSLPPGTTTYSLMTIEPAVFLALLGVVLTTTVTQTFFLERVCEQELGLNHTQCLQLDGAAKADVQRKAADLLMIKTLIENLLPAVMSLFLGPWSDKNGRRPLLMWPMLGYSLTYSLYAVLSTQQHLKTRHLLAASLPVAVSGGFISILSSSNSYVTDITTTKQRSVRLGVLDACLYLSLLVGSAGFAPLLTVSGFVGVYTTAAALCFISFLYILILVKESVPLTWQRQLEGQDCCSPCSALFHFEMLREVINACLKWRPNYGRAIILLVTAAIASGAVAAEGENIVFYLFTNKAFGWNVQDFSVFASITIFLRIAVMIGGVYVLSHRLNLSDAAVNVVAYMSRVIGSLIAAFSMNVWFLYLASACSIFSGMTGPLNRAILTKVVPGQDVGKVFSLMASMEALTPLMAAPLYTFVYEGTILRFPGAFFLVSAAIFSLDTFLLWTVRYLQTSPQSDYEEISG